MNNVDTQFVKLHFGLDDVILISDHPDDPKDVGDEQIGSGDEQALEAANFNSTIGRVDSSGGSGVDDDGDDGKRDEVDGGWREVGGGVGEVGGIIGPRSSVVFPALSDAPPSEPGG